ncbi:MAG: hypothetical protein M0Z89_12775 [Nitrospiraceae bacterium]|nr:hypothetical protein [Nitrospiraceae bacterium]
MASTKIKPRLSFTLLCDDVRQEMGGKFSLMGLFESISSHSFPALHHRFAIMNEWTGGKGDFTVRIRLLTPDQAQVLSESETKLSLFSETQRHRDISIRYNTTFKVPGTYWIETLLDNERIGLAPLVLQTINDQLVH